MFAALQLDNETASSLSTFKRAFTPAAVRRIHEAVVEYWPPDTDLSEVLEPDPKTVRALYVGHYEPESLAKGVARHCLYADKISLVDPFMYAVGINQSTARWSIRNTTGQCASVGHKYGYSLYLG
jgi:hypothetical protein